MAIRGAVRWRPDTYRSPLLATVAELDPTAEPPTGSIVMVAQLVAYDDTQLTGANYQPGHPDTERKLVILHERTYTKELAAFATMTQSEASAAWADTLADYKAWVLPAGPTLLKAIRAARTAAPQVI